MLYIHIDQVRTPLGNTLKFVSSAKTANDNLAESSDDSEDDVPAVGREKRTARSADYFCPAETDLIDI